MVDCWCSIDRQNDKLDLSTHLVVVPTGTALRQTLATLAQKAKAEKILLFPPRIITAGQLDVSLLPTTAPLATPIERELAWSSLLAEQGPDVRRALLPKIPEPAIDASLRRLAKLLVDADDQLSAENLSLADLPDRVTNPTPLSLARWKVIVSLVPAYRVKLKDAGRIDPAQHRQEMLSEPILPYPGPIWLLGTVDLQPAHLRILQAVAQAGTPITSLVIAPPNRQDDFDEFGILRTGQWLDRPIPIDDDQIIIAADPSDEALATLSILHDWREINPADIAIGILDPQIIPRLIEPGRKLGWEIDPYRIPRPDRSRPLTFLRLVADYQAQESAESLARLIRHPDLEGFLIAHAAAEDRDPIADLDQIRSRRLPKSISCTELVERDGLSWGTDFSSLLKDWPRGDRNLREWIDRFIEILIPLYQHLSEQELPADLDHVASALRGAAEIPALLLSKGTAHDALDLVCRFYTIDEDPPETNRPLIRGLGWLDLPLDRAGHLIIAGMNQESVSSPVSRGLITERIQKDLELNWDQDRRARDRYFLEWLLASRKVKVILARQSADRDPLTPSSLLLADSAVVRAKRLSRFFDEPLPTRSIARPSSAPFKIQPPTLPIPPAINELRVTAFRDYLLCPYRFYLRHVRKLVTVDDQQAELDAPSFGSLFHDIFEAFGRSPLAHSPDASAISAFVEGEWRDRERNRYRGSLPSVLIQGEQIKRRLFAFANWQAQWFAQGWRILHVELEATATSASIVVDDKPFYLTGRIDRIDQNINTGEIAIIDYKTGDALATPEDRHRKKGEWTDLQLPLYRHLVLGTKAAQDIARGAGPPVLGYIATPKSTEDTNFYRASWEEEDLASADDAARRVVRGLRQGIFEPRSCEKGAIDSFSEFSRICQDGILGHE